MDNTNNFYNKNAKDFFDGTVNADMKDNYKQFLEYIPQGGSILDAGCGSGRDSLAFKEMGYSVTSIDGSEELCKLATDYIGEAVRCIKFEELEFEDEFDGIWACATLLHVKSKELEGVIKRLKRALKLGGVIYASFKCGEFEGERNGRYFYDLTEDKARNVFESKELKIEGSWITGDVREGRGEEKWVNLICRR